MKMKLMFCLACAGLLFGSARAVDVSTADELKGAIESDASASITLVAGCCASGNRIENFVSDVM